MPVTTKNTELIPQSELNLLIKYNAELTTTKNNLGATIPVLHEAAMGVETYSGDYGTLVKMLKTFEKLQQDTNTRVKEHNRALTNLEKANKRLSYSRSDEAKKLAEVREQTRKNNLELRTAAKESLAAENSLEQLRATLARLKAEAATLDINSEEFVKLSADINELNAKILTAEASMGDHRRNVGNYASGFNALGFEVQQIVRELPSLTVSSSQFFLAISNNLPMLVDKLAKAKAEQKALKEEGKSGVPVWKQLIKSAVSWQTLLVVGITLITAYSKDIGEFFKELFTGEKALVDLADAHNKYIGSVNSEISRMYSIVSALKGAEKGTNEYEQAKQALIDQYGSYLPDLEDEINSLSTELDLRNKLAIAIQKEVFAKKRAETLDAAQEKYEEKISKLQDKEKYQKLFQQVFGGDWNKQFITYTLGLTGDEDQQAISQQIYDKIYTYYEEAKVAATAAANKSIASNTPFSDEQRNIVNNFLKDLGFEETIGDLDGERRVGLVNIAASGMGAIETFQKDLKEIITPFREVEEETSKWGEDMEAALAVLYPETPNENVAKTITTIRKEVSKLQEELEKIPLDDEHTAQFEEKKAELKAKQKELEAYEKLYSTDSGSGRLSEKRQSELSLLEKQAEYTADIQEGIFKNEELSYQERMAAFDKFKVEQEKALTVHYDALREELAARKSAGDIDGDIYTTVLEEINFDADIDLREMRASHEEAGKGLMDSIANGMMKESTDAVTQATKKLDDEMMVQLTELAQRYAAGEINAEDYEKRKSEIAVKYQKDRFEAETKAFDEFLEKAELTAEVKEALQKAKDDAMLKYSQYINDMTVKDAEETGKKLLNEAEKQKKIEEEKAKEIANHKKGLMQEVFNLAAALGEAQLKKDLGRLDKLSEANEEWKNGEIERIERLEEQGVISKEQAEARKQAIEDQAAAKEKEIEAQRIEAERKNAIYQKATAATQAIINTALAVTGALGTPYLIPLILATGAAQLATILAQPLPEYAHGTSNHPGGLAIVGDGGRSELVLFPDNSIWRTPSTDTLVNLPAGSQVLPDYDEVIAQFAISRFRDRPTGTARVEALLEEQKLQRAMLIEKSCERNSLLRQMLSAKDGKRRAANRERALAILNKKKLQK